MRLESTHLSSRPSSRRTGMRVKGGDGLLTRSELAELYARLIAERGRTLDHYRRDRREGLEWSPEPRTEDLAGRAEMNAERDELYARTDAERGRLGLIDEALARMEEGTYGLCLYSGEPIPLARLRQIPWARYTAPVQERIEAGKLAERELWETAPVLAPRLASFRPATGSMALTA